MELLKDSITSGLTDLGNNILNGLKDMFIPTFSPLWKIRSLIHDKLPPLDQLLHIFGNVLGDTSEYAPTFSITYKGNTYNIVDFSVFTPYRPILFIIQNAIYWYLFVRWFIKFIPSIISGIGGVVGK